MLGSAGGLLGAAKAPSQEIFDQAYLAGQKSDGPVRCRRRVLPIGDGLESDEREAQSYAENI
jgi:hypothetical protein